jgi:hypothetical protein
MVVQMVDLLDLLAVMLAAAMVAAMVAPMAASSVDPSVVRSDWLVAQKAA